MRRIPLLLLTCGLLTLAAFALQATAQNGPPPGGSDGGSGPTTRPDGPHPGGFHLLPRFVVEKLNLTADQHKQIAELERETKAKLDLILTADQIKTLDSIRPPRPNGGPPSNGGNNTGGGQGGGPGGGQSPGGQSGGRGGMNMDRPPRDN